MINEGFIEESTFAAMNKAERELIGCFEGSLNPPEK